MINLELRRPIKTEISKYLYNTHTTKNLQTEMDDFLGKIKPSLREKVTKTSFVAVIDANYVMRNLLKERTDQIFQMSMNMMKTQIKNAKMKFKDKLVTKLVS